MTRARDKASAVVANFASTGIDDNADANAITINSSELVGIGTAAPSGAKLEIFTGSTSTDGLKINRFASGAYYSTLRQDSHGLAVHVGDGSSISERAAITPNGITFNGDTAAANALDDYEEGTWTPVDGSGAGLSFTVGATSNYIKIGRLVLFNFYITYPSTSSTATASIGGLPYAVTSSGFFYANYRSSALGANNLLIQLNQGSTVMSLYNADAGYNNATLSGAYFLASGSYMTS